MTLKQWLEEERKHARARRSGPGRPARGTQEWLAYKLGIDQGLVSKYVRRITTPERYGTKIVKMSGGKVTLAELMRVPRD